LSCFRESHRSGDSEEDTFSSLFWEKDFQHIQVETADDLGGEEGVLEIFDIRKLEEVLDPDRFRIPAEKEVILIQQAASREQEFAAGKFNFDLSREDLERISQLKAEGENPESLGNFLDLLFEFLAAAPDPALLQDAGRAIRALFTGLVRSLDLEAARAILEGLTGRSNRGGGAPIRFWLKELLQGLWDKTTQRVIYGFLKDHPSLDPTHEVFKLMKSLDPDALPLLIEFLKIHSHRDAVSDVLVHLGKGCADLFTSYLLDPDAKLVLSLVQVLLRVEPGCAERIALAFKHPDASVRLETARILWNLKDPRAGESFLSLLDESSRECVKAALEFLSWAPCPSAFRKLAALVRSTRFDQLDKSHQRLCFQALLLADPSRGVRLISRILRPWWFDVGSDSVLRKETAILALAAVHDNPAAEALLRHTARRGRWQGQLARQALAERKRTLAGRGPEGGPGS
jgi:hypothetical protein